MKSAIKIIILSIILTAGTWSVPKKASAQVSVSFQLFYDDLSPYGYWVDNSDYGYVWVPNVAPGFTPYGTNGHWVFTNAGWTWYSDYSWGWAPFHYGRWYSDPVYGPMWVPGNEWGPGWVTWRSSPDYFGWAPIGPGVSIEFAYSSGYEVPNNQWVFVRGTNFGRANISTYYVDASTNVTIINNTTVINNIQSDGGSGTRYNAGPSKIEAEKRAGKSFTPVAIKESKQPAQRLNSSELQIYRPRIQKDAGNGKKATPTKVASLTDVKPAAERNPKTQSPEKNQPGNDKEQGQPQHNQQPKKEQPAKHQQQGQPKHQQPSQPQRNEQPKKEQPAQHQQDGQPEKHQPSQPQQQDHPKKEQPAQRQHDGQPEKRQPSQPQQQEHPKKEQPAQHRQGGQPEKQQPTKRQPVSQPKKSPQPKQTAPPKKEKQTEQQQPNQEQNKMEQNKPEENKPR